MGEEDFCKMIKGKVLNKYKVMIFLTALYIESITPSDKIVSMWRTHSD